MKILTRPILNDQYKQIHYHHLIYIQAPPGYGKTTALKNYTDRLKNKDVIYFSTAFHEDDQFLFQEFNKQINAFNKERWKPIPISHAIHDVEAYARILKETLQNNTLIVMDDCNFKSNSIFERFLISLASKKIDKLHIIVMSRHDPNPNMKEVIYQNQCLLIRKNAFLFSQSDIKKLLEINQLKLNDVSAVWKLTQGWIKGIVAFCEGHEENKALAYENLQIIIKSTFFDNLNMRQQKVLMKLSVLEEFRMDCAMYLIQEYDHNVILDVILGNSFIITNANGTYTITQVYRDLLYQELIRSQIHSNYLYEKLAEWYYMHQDYKKAMSINFKRKKYPAVLKIYENIQNTDFTEHHFRLLENLFDMIAPELKYSYPIAYLKYLSEIIYVIDKEKGEQQLNQFKFELYNYKLSSTEDNILAEIALIEAYIHNQNITDSLIYIKKSYQLFNGNRSVVWNANLMRFTRTFYILANFNIPAGELNINVEAIINHMKYLTRITGGCDAGIEYQIRAEFLLEQCKYNDAFSYALQAYHQAQLYREKYICLCSLFTMARCSIALGNAKGLNMAMEALSEMIQEKDNDLLLDTSIKYAIASIQMLLGEIDNFIDWLYDIIKKGELHKSFKIQFYMLQVGSSLIQGNYHIVSVLIEVLAESEKDENRVFSEIYKLKYQIKLFYVLGDIDSAIAELGKLITILRKDDMILSVVESAYTLLPLLEMIEDDKDDYIKCLIEECKAYTENRKHIIENRKHLLQM